MEITEKIIGDMVRAFADEVREEKLDGERIRTAASQHLQALQVNGRIFFQKWATLCVE